MARQSNVGSPPPPAMDIDTPDGSVFGDYTSSEPQYEYPWPKKVLKNMEEYERWLSDEWKRVKRVRYCGPTGEPWPKKPSVDFKKLLEEGKNGTKVLCRQELHSYLVANCAISDEVVWPEIPENGLSSLEKMKAHLKAGWEKLKQHKKHVGFPLDVRQNA